MRLSKVLIIALTLSVAVSSCKKKDSSTPVTATCQLTSQTDDLTGKPTNVIYKNGNPYRIIQSNGSFNQFHYNSSGQADTLKGYDATSTLTNFQLLTYNSDGKIFTAEYYNRVSGHPDSSVAQSKNTFEYTGGNLTKSNYYDYNVSVSTINSYSTYEYDAAGNKTKSSYYSLVSGSYVLSYTETFTYDNKKAIINGKLGQLLGNTSPNNSLVHVVTNYTPSTSTSTDSTVYEYNSNSYPVKSTQFNQDGSVSQYSFTYDCN